MNSRIRPLAKRSATRILVLTLALAPWLLAGASLAAPPPNQLYYNQDCTEFFVTREIPDGKAGESIDRYVDEIADAGVTVFLCNTNARRTNYPSRVWDAFWDGYDPTGPADQPFLAPAPPEERAIHRKLIDAMWRVHQQGVDYPARVIARCRDRGVAPWISLRMNDCHYNDVSNHPFHGAFWVENPQFRRQNSVGYFANCLDYARPEVRDYYMALVRETLERYDVDGLELDFMREPYVFSAGGEREGAPILTAWIRDVRRAVDEAAARRGHPIQLGARAPSRPETAIGMGLDAALWAKEGLLDVLVVTPRWATLEFNMGVAEWRRQLGDAKTTLLGGLEVLYRPAPGEPATVVSPELAKGAASVALADGADAVYLFNYFPGCMAPPAYQDALRAMRSLDALQAAPRTVGVTYRDVVAPGEPYQPPLPTRGAEARFAMKFGPEPPAGWRREAVISLDPEADSPPAKPQLTVDGDPCDLIGREEAGDGVFRATFRLAVRPWTRSQTHEVKITTSDGSPLLVRRVEVKFNP